VITGPVAVYLTFSCKTGKGKPILRVKERPTFGFGSRKNKALHTTKSTPQVENVIQNFFMLVNPKLTSD
jgi:hypothetical protein